MKNSDLQLDRLLRAAAEATSPLPNEMPFGFATRVLAGWPTDRKRDLVDLGRLLRRVALLSLGVIVLATAGVYNELRQNDDLGDSFDEYVIADSAISNAVEP